MIVYQIGHVGFSLLTVSWTNLQQLRIPPVSDMLTAPVLRLQRVPRPFVFSLFFVDLLMRALRTAVFFSEFHLLVSFVANLVLVFWMLPAWCICPRHCTRGGLCDGHTRVWGFLVVLFSYTVSPWTLLSSPTFRPDFNLCRYSILFVLEVLGTNAVVALLAVSKTAATSVAASFENACLVDVAGMCATNIAPDSCFPFGVVAAYASAWVCQVALWVWAAVLMWWVPVGSALLKPVEVDDEDDD